MPSRGVNLLPEMLEPIIRRINNRKEDSDQNAPNDPEDDIVELEDLGDIEELGETE